MMELTTPGPLSEQLSLHDKQSTENSILREHLKFDYSNTLNGDKNLKTEVGDTSNIENTLPKESELSVEKEKEHNQISPDPDLNHQSSNININENSSNIDGSLQGATNTKISSKTEGIDKQKSLQLVNDIFKTNDGTSKVKEMSPSDVESSDISSNTPKEEISTAHQEKLNNQNINGNCLAQPNASIKSSNEVSEIEISDYSSAEGSWKTDSSKLRNEVNGDEEIKPGTSNSQLDADTTSFDSIVEKDTIDKDIDMKDVNIVNECKHKEKLPSQSNDLPIPLIPQKEEAPIPTSTIVQSSVLWNGNERVKDNRNIEPELSKVHLKIDHFASSDQESSSPINGQNPIRKDTDKHPSKESSTTPNSNSNDQPSASVPSSNPRQVPTMPPVIPPAQKTYDYLLKVLLVGDSDVGKQEIISDMEDGTTDSPFCSSAGAGFKTTIILIDGKRVKLQLWDTSGQGRFCTIIRSYSRGAQGILLVYDITNKWSFEGINRWLKEVDQHAPGIPKVLVGNRLHLAFKRQVHQEEAEEYAERNSMGFFEVSPLVNFNISETLVELARMALRRNGMERWNGRSNKVSTLYELCAHSIVNRTTVYGIDRLKLPTSVKQNLKSYAVTNYSISQTNKKFLRRPGSSSQYYASGSFKNRQSGGSPASSICNSLRRVHRNRQHTPLANTPADAANVNCGPSRKSCTIS